MAHPLHHAESSARKFGGVPSDYQAVHDWFDASKEHLALFTHRAMRHHAQGLFEAVTWTDKRKFHRASMRDRPAAALPIKLAVVGLSRLASRVHSNASPRSERSPSILRAIAQ